MTNTDTDTDKFSVLWYDPDGNVHWERREVGAQEAVETARSLAFRPAATILKIIRRIMIVDQFDFCVFLWDNGKGIRYPVGDEPPPDDATAVH